MSLFLLILTLCSLEAAASEIVIYETSDNLDTSSLGDRYTIKKMSSERPRTFKLPPKKVKDIVYKDQKISAYFQSLDILDQDLVLMYLSKGEIQKVIKKYPSFKGQEDSLSQLGKKIKEAF